MDREREEPAEGTTNGPATARTTAPVAAAALRRFAWLPREMPGVARLVREKRALHGDAHVNECWQRGVIAREPGWFFAREGALAVGTPWDDPALANFAAAQVSATQALLLIKPPEASHGAH